MCPACTVTLSLCQWNIIIDRKPVIAGTPGTTGHARAPATSLRHEHCHWHGVRRDLRAPPCQCQCKCGNCTCAAVLAHPLCVNTRRANPEPPRNCRGVRNSLPVAVPRSCQDCIFQTPVAGVTSVVGVTTPGAPQRRGPRTASHTTHTRAVLYSTGTRPLELRTLFRRAHTRFELRT